MPRSSSLVALVLCLVASVGHAATPSHPRATRAIGQPIRPNLLDTARRIDVNQVNMWATNYGTFAWDIGGTGGAGFEFPRGSGHTAIFASGLWLGAQVGLETRVTVAEYNSEYRPGPILPGGSPDDPNRFEHVVYKVVRFTGSPNDTAHVETVPGDPYTDPLRHHSWSEYMHGAAPYGAPWRLYRLPDTSTPAPNDSIDVPGPDVLGDQMLWSVYNDADPTAHTSDPGHTTPLGVEVQQTTWAFDRSGPLGNALFVKFKIINKGDGNWSPLFTSIWSDPDVGGPSDDFVGCDVPRNMGYAYNATNADLQYGSRPPAVGYDLLRGPIGPFQAPYNLTAFSRYINGTDPTNPSDTYNYMQGLLPDGSPVIDPVTNQITTYFVPGDPITATGWVDDVPGDRRMLLSAGPLSMAYGDTNEVVIAIIASQAEGNLAAIAQLRCDDDYVQTAFDQGEPFPPVPTECPMIVNCPRPLGFWQTQCPSGGGELTQQQMAQVAGWVNDHSTFFDWTDPLAQFCGLKAPGVPDIRTLAKQQYATLLANVGAGQLGTLPTDGRPIRLLPLTPVSCPNLQALNVNQLIDPAIREESLNDALYFNDVTDHRRAIEGVDAGFPFFNGGATTGDQFFGSTLDPAAMPDSFATVELRFSHTATQKAYRYLRLETETSAPPINGREYRYGGHHDVPFTCWDVEHNVQLEVAFVERTVTDDFGTILPGAFQVATFDSTWGPDDSQVGGREYLFVFNRPYRDTPRPEFAEGGVIADGSLPVLYVLWSKLRTAGDVIDDGDRFQWQWGFPPSPGIDAMLFNLEPQSLGDPAVQAAYGDIVNCLSAINSGQGIGPTCDNPTPVLVSLVDAIADPDRVSLTWSVDGAVSFVATLERQSPGRDWEALARVEADGQNRVTYQDGAVEPGSRYGYRLAVPSAQGIRFLGEAWVEVPATARLSLAGFRPNPARGRDVSIAFSLASRERASLELYDIAGRRVFTREVGMLGPGSHTLAVDDRAALRPGIYVVRLKQGDRDIRAKAALVR
jgi:hypothetical protein